MGWSVSFFVWLSCRAAGLLGWVGIFLIWRRHQPDQRSAFDVDCSGESPLYRTLQCPLCLARQQLGKGLYFVAALRPDSMSFLSSIYVSPVLSCPELNAVHRWAVGARSLARSQEGLEAPLPKGWAEATTPAGVTYYCE